MGYNDSFFILSLNPNCHLLNIRHYHFIIKYIAYLWGEGEYIWQKSLLDMVIFFARIVGNELKKEK